MEYLYQCYILKPKWVTREQACSRDDKLKEFKPSRDAVSSRPKTDPERQKLLQGLVRYAFTDDRDLLSTRDNDRDGHWFSFCKNLGEGSWIDTNQAQNHCWVCGECKSIYDWHCKVCNKRVEAPGLVCDGCGGCSSFYHASFKSYGYC
jgi:hypothetical protein